MNKIMYLYIAMMFPLLLFVMFYITGMREGVVPFSSEAFIQPYYGDKSFTSSVLGAIAVGHVLLYHIYILPMFLKDQKTHLVALASSEMTALFGFVIGFMNINPWASLPYFAVSLANFGYAFVRISQADK